VKSGPTVTVSGAGAQVIPIFLCPSDTTGAIGTGRPAGEYGGAHLWSASCYAANYLVFGAPLERTWQLRSEGIASLDTTFQDGTTNTIVFAERYASCGSSGDPNKFNVYANLWGDSSNGPGNGFRAAFCINDESQRPDLRGYLPCLTFQEAPHWYNTCDPRRAQSPHANVMNVSLGDGSVRTVSSSIAAATWQRLCDPRDGEVIDAF
jgi:hypothetical protein